MITPIEAQQESVRDRSDYQRACAEYVAASFQELETDLSKLDMPKFARIAIDSHMEGITRILEKVEE